jgi:uncharacterized iron-regulated protein
MGRLAARRIGHLSARGAVALALGVAGPAAAASGEPPPLSTAPLLRDHPLLGRIWNPADGRPATAADVVAAAAAADFVLLGETHDNPDSHALQAWLLRRLIAAGRNPAVAFEMIDTDRGAAVDTYLAGHPGDAAGLGAALEWDQSGWPDWALYQPIVAAALSAHLPLLAAGLPRPVVRAVVGGHPPPEVALDLATPLAPATDAAMRAEIADAHCGMLPAEALPGMVRVQRARDAAMAHALVEGDAAQGSAVLIAGSGHVRDDRGVPAWLARLAPGRRVLSVAFVEVDSDETDPAAYAQTFNADRLPFDFVWFTPRADRPDPCETFKTMIKRRKG